MRRIKLMSCLLAAVVFTGLRAGAQDAQDEAIKKVILTETRCFLARDAEGWQATWLHDSKATSTFSGLMGYNTVTGWENFGDKNVKWLKENPKKDSSELTTDSFMIRKDGKLAIASYKQTIKFQNTLPPFDKRDSREERVLVKKDGQWKITSMLSTDLNGTTADDMEMSLNAAGYNFLFAGKLEEAIKVLELNTQLYPNSWNVFDSLGEAYAKAGKKEQAIQNYEKSIQLNPKNETGATALKKLKEQ